MGHYFYFLSYFNRMILIFVSVVLAKWNKASLKKVGELGKGMLIVGVSTNLLYPLLIWLCVKFRYHFPLELSCGVVANIEPIFYLFTKFGTGNFVHLPIAQRLSELSIILIFQAPLTTIS